MAAAPPRPAPAPATNPVLRQFALAVALCGATFAAYFPSLAGELIWNDLDYVTKPALRSLAGLGRIWTEPGATEQYYPLLHSAFWLQFRLWGLHPLGYHLVTVALHAGSAVLFALVLRRLAVPGAWLAAFLFALHPVHAESVAWITEQKNTLSLVFYLGAALPHLRFEETRGRGAYAGALGLFLLSLLCKTVTATLPAALLVVRWWRRGRLEWRDVRPLLPWFVLAAAMGWFTSWVERHYVGAQGENFDLPLLERTLVAGRCFWFYLGQIIWPARLNFIYYRWTPDATVVWQWLFPLTALGLFAGLWVLRRRTRAPLAAALFFAGSLFPVLGFVNLYGALYSWVWDHWQYLPDLGPLALIAAGLVRGWEAVPARWRPLGPAGAGLLLGGLGAMTWQHTGMFHDDLTLFRMTLARNPDSWMAHYDLGTLLAKSPAGVPEAMEHFRATLRLRPGYAGAHINLGVALAGEPGRQAEAMAQFEAAAKSEPGNPKVWYNLANLLAADPARVTEAIADYEHALQLMPEYPEAHDNLGKLLATLPGRGPDAIAHFQAALALEPDLASAHNNLGDFLGKDPGRLPEAVAHLETAVRLDPGFPEAHYNLGNLLARMPDRQTDAIAHYETALRLKPAYAQAHVNLGIALAQSRDHPREALAHFETAVRLDPGNAGAHLNLGICLSQVPGRIPEALAELTAAVRLNPASAESHYTLGIVLWRSQHRAEAHAEFEAALCLRPDWATARQLADQTQP
jgi:tetratricopeptide (TPR) repeat protein